MYTTVVCGMAFLPLPTFSSWKKMFPKATMWLTDVFIRFGHIQKRAASKQEVLMIKFMVLLSFVYNSIEKDHIKIALPLLYCTYFAGLLLFRQSTKSIRKRETFLSVSILLSWQGYCWEHGADMGLLFPLQDFHKISWCKNDTRPPLFSTYC